MPTFEEDDYLAHYGILRKSGRYPWGSGGNSSGNKDLDMANDFQRDLKRLRSEGYSDSTIAKMFEMSTNELRANITISNIVRKQDQINTAEKLARTGMSNSAISREMFGTSSKESTVRGLLNEQSGRKKHELEVVADALRKRVDESSGYIDIGVGNEHHLRITKTKFDTAVAMLKTEGYVVESVSQPQATTQHSTRVRVLAKPGETWSSISQNTHKIESIKIFSNDGGKTQNLWQEPLKLDPSRVDIKYKEQGGADADGVIYVRPGVKDLSMGSASYAQVRIAVGKNHYIKGMAVLKDGLPPGVDVQFNTNKSNTGNKMDALKKVKEGEPIERFGAVFRQITDEKTGKVVSHLNIVNDDENWDKWSNSLATQMLSKQKPDFVKRQLDVTYAQKKAQLDEILALTNPVVKKKLLQDYADNMDSASVHLKAAALPRQKTHVILPVNSLKDNEVYAPGYKNGEKVVLIRYPHGGKFEIPELTVNNGNREAKSIIPTGSKNAIGINSKVANVLSGADFDGDTVVVIPNPRGRIQRESPLQGLKGFDPQEAYRGSNDGGETMLPGVKKMKNTQTEMGKISNLITDMTIAGATHEELARAVRHSMVVIDAEKHGLDYQRSAKENAINALSKKYQPGRTGGASTIISRTKRPAQVDDYKLRPKKDGGGVDPKTGEPIYVPSGKTSNKPILDKEGNVTGWEKVPRQTKVKTGSRVPGITIVDPGTGKRVPVKDAYDLVSGNADTPRALRGSVVERHYAEYSNQVRGLANQARLADLNTPDPKVNMSSKKAYAPEVSSLKAKLKIAESNSPRERQAQVAAGVIINMMKKQNPSMSSAELKKVKDRAIKTTRDRLNAKPQRIEINSKEWEAIQNGAVASDVLRKVLAKADMDQVKKLAQPKTKLLMQPHNITLARSLLNSGYTRAEVADHLGVSVSTLDRSL